MADQIGVAYGLSVDLGTTYTAAATLRLDQAAAPTVFGLGNRASQIPSVVFIEPDGRAVVGEAAERRGAAVPSRVVREFKRRIGDPIPIIVAGSPFSAQALTARLLRAVVDQATDRLGGPPAWVILTHPANWGPFKIDLLHQAAAMANLDRVDVCTEPAAAAYEYGAINPVRIGDRVCIFDLGGGTFDVCVLQRAESGFVLLGQPDGLEHLGGADFDEAVFRHVVNSLQLTNDQSTAELEWARLRRDCVDAKEALSVDTETVIVANLGGRSRQIRLTRVEFNDMIRPAIQETVEATKRALRSADVAAADLSAFVLVGGSSGIPLITEMLVAEFDRPIARAANPKQVVSLGAVRVAASRYQDPRGADATMRIALPGVGSATMPVAGAAPVQQLPKEPGTGFLGTRKSRLIAAGAAAAVVAVAATAAVVFWPRNTVDPGGAGAGVTTAASTASTTATTPPTTSSPPTTTSAPVVDIPRSAQALPDHMIIAPLDLDGNANWALYPVDTRDGKVGPKLTTDGIEKVALSPDRRTILYFKTQNPRTIMSINAADGTDERPIFDHDQIGCDKFLTPAWNPLNGDEIALACYKGKTYRLLILSLAGTLIREVPIQMDFIDGLTYSPDGKTLAFFGKFKPNDPYMLFTLPAEGSTELNQLTFPSVQSSYDPMWSDNGRDIVFMRLRATIPAGPLYELRVINSSTKEERVLVSGPGNENHINPSYSVNGDFVIYRSSRGLENTQLYRFWIVRADGSQPRLLIQDGPMATAFAAAPAAWGRR